MASVTCSPVAALVSKYRMPCVAAKSSPSVRLTALRPRSSLLPQSATEARPLDLQPHGLPLIDAQWQWALVRLRLLQPQAEVREALAVRHVVDQQHRLGLVRFK